MDLHHEGGCLCGAVRYLATDKPVRVTICFCRFCQRATGSTHLVEPIFAETAFKVTLGEPSIFTLTSEGSGKQVHVHFCAACGTKLFLSFERFPGVVGVYAGAFDEPGWFDMTPETAACIFIDSASPGAILPAGIPAYREHVRRPDGARNAPEVFAVPFEIGRKPNA